MPVSNDGNTNKDLVFPGTGRTNSGKQVTTRENEENKDKESRENQRTMKPNNGAYHQPVSQHHPKFINDYLFSTDIINSHNLN